MLLQCWVSVCVFRRMPWRKELDGNTRAWKRLAVVEIVLIGVGEALHSGMKLDFGVYTFAHFPKFLLSSEANKKFYVCAYGVCFFRDRGSWTARNELDRTYAVSWGAFT